jgi:KTSC domain
MPRSGTNSSANGSSTAIEAIDYDLATRQLRVTFPGGNTYKYYDVPRGVYQGFLDAESKGLFFNAYIRDRYDFALATAA